MKKVFTNTIIYSGKEIYAGVAILVNESRIEGFVYDTDIPSDYNMQDLGGNNIAPAFIDLQIYGAGGFLFSASPSQEGIIAVKEYCLRGGCANFLLTIATNSPDTITRCINEAKTYRERGGKGLLGLHLEGPWINPEKRGAHQLQYIHPPDIDEVKRLTESAEGVVKMITLAPEMADEKITDYLQEKGIIISAGHSNATYGQAIKGFEKIKTVTHLFNAMSPLQGREAGLVGAVFGSSDVHSSIVADGVHVDFASVKLSKQILGERLFLITDAVTETTEGAYQHLYKNDRYTLPDGTLSGSSLTMMKAVKNCVDHAGIPLEEALRMASCYPAKIAGLETKVGMIERGYNAAFVIFDHELNVIETIDGCS